MLDSVEIERFRGIRKGGLSGLGPVNILVGKNGSGKSSVLEAIDLVAMQCGADGNAFYNLRGINSQSPNLFYGHDTHVPLKITLGFGRMEGESESSRPRVTLTMSAGPSQINVSIAPIARDLATDWRDFLGRTRLLSTTELLGPRGRDIEEKSYRLVARPRKDRVVVKHLNDIYGLTLEGFTYLTNQNNQQVLEAQFADRDFTLDLDDLGAGIRVTVRLLFVAVLAGGSALLVEEFDAYQHVSALERLATALLGMAMEQRTQLFLTTHSLETVQAFVAAEQRIGKAILRVFQTDLAPDGTFTSAALSGDQVGRLVGAGLDVRQT